MMSLEEKHPAAHEALQVGKFVVQQSTSSSFSQVAIDQTIEQTINRDTKSRDQLQVCRGSFHQSWHEDFQCPGQQCSSIALTSLLYTTVKPVESGKASDLDEVLLTRDKVHFNQLCYIG